MALPPGPSSELPSGARWSLQIASAIFTMRMQGDDALCIHKFQLDGGGPYGMKLPEHMMVICMLAHQQPHIHWHRHVQVIAAQHMAACGETSMTSSSLWCFRTVHNNEPPARCSNHYSGTGWTLMLHGYQVVLKVPEIETSRWPDQLPRCLIIGSRSIQLGVKGPDVPGTLQTPVPENSYPLGACAVPADTTVFRGALVGVSASQSAL